MGTTDTPPPVTVVTVGDSWATVVLQAHKYNARQPETGVPGATYDLYLEGAPPPDITTPTAPPGAAILDGDTWFARGTTDATGDLSFSIPAGFAWCLQEVTSPWM